VCHQSAEKLEMGTILSNNRIKGDPALNLSSVSGSVLESMLLVDLTKSLFQQTASECWKPLVQVHFCKTIDKPRRQKSSENA
jgi:hypothetical protein